MFKRGIHLIGVVFVFCVLACCMFCGSEIFSQEPDDLSALRLKAGVRILDRQDPNYSEIYDVIRNYFSHQYDVDKNQCLLSVSKDISMMVDKQEMVDIDYEGLKANLEKRGSDVKLISINDFKIEKIIIKGDFAKAEGVAFRRKLMILGDVPQKRLEKMKLKEGVFEDAIDREIFLKKEDEGWKIIELRVP